MLRSSGEEVKVHWCGVGIIHYIINLKMSPYLRNLFIIQYYQQSSISDLSVSFETSNFMSFHKTKISAIYDFKLVNLKVRAKMSHMERP